MSENWKLNWTAPYSSEINYIVVSTRKLSRSKSSLKPFLIQIVYIYNLTLQISQHLYWKVNFIIIIKRIEEIMENTLALSFIQLVFGKVCYFHIVKVLA